MGNGEQTHRRWSVPIARIAGIEVRVHATFLLLVALFAAAGAAPGGPGVLDSLEWLVILFACVLLHELAHCLVGRRRGLIVHEIDLLPIGGVSRLESVPETPSDELAMSIAGPAASLLIGVAAAALALAWSQTLYPVDLVAGPLLVRIAWVNVILAAFNMLPAFPLDGGRVFRALLEQRFDLATATRIAGRTGRVLAVVLIAVGLVVDVWLTFIGFFVYFGATAEEQATLVHVRLGGRRVRDVMVLDPATVDVSTSVAELRDLARHNPQRVYPVLRADRYVGAVDVRALAQMPLDRPIGTVTVTAAGRVGPDDELEQDLATIATAVGGALPVVEGSRVVGLLQVEDVQQLALGASEGGATRASRATTPRGRREPGIHAHEEESQ